MEMAESKIAAAIENMIIRGIRSRISQRSRIGATFLATHLGVATDERASPGQCRRTPAGISSGWTTRNHRATRTAAPITIKMPVCRDMLCNLAWMVMLFLLGHGVP